MSGFVYFVRCGDFVKIGFSADVPKRLRAISTGSPFDLTLIAAHPGTRDTEKKLHAALAPFRVKREWFAFCPEVEKVATEAAFCAPTASRAPRRGQKLRQWMSERKISDTEFASAVGSTARAVRKWRYGERCPPTTKIARIEDITRHAVNLRDFVAASAA